jgi:uncharacterized protein YfaS (alpha-2-macroglobulin family)
LKRHNNAKSKEYDLKAWKLLMALAIIATLSVIGVKIADNYTYLPDYLLPINENFYFYLGFGFIFIFFAFWLKSRKNAIRLTRTIRTLFGEINWDAPNWLKASIDRGVFKSIAFYLRSTKVWILAFLVVTSFGGVCFLDYLANKPKVSDKVESVDKSIAITISSPAATTFRKGSQGEVTLKTYPLRLNFSGNAADLKMRDQVVKKGITISPAIEGEWKWEGQDSLVFKPKKDWGVGENYVVKIDKSLVAENVVPRETELRFQTQPFSGYSNTSEFYENPIDPLDKKVVSSFNFSHPVKIEDLQNAVSVNLFTKVGKAWSFQKKISFQLIKNGIGLGYSVHSEKVSLANNAQKISVVVSQSLSSSYANKALIAEISSDTVIPSIDQFYYFDSPNVKLIENSNGEQEQVLFLKASTAVKADDVPSFIEIFELPKTDRYYSDPIDLPKSVFQAKKLIKAIPMPSEREFSKEHFLKLKVQQGGQLLVNLRSGLPSYEGYKLSNDYSYVLKVPRFTSTAKIIPNGNILRLEGDGQVSLMLRNIKKAKVEISQVLKNQVHHYLIQNRNSMEKPEFDNYGFNESHFSRTVMREIKVPNNGDLNKSFYSLLDLKRLLRNEFGGSKGRGFFIMKVKKGDEYYPSDKRLIILSDYAMIAKRQSDSSYQVFVYNITSQTAATGVQVEVIGPNGLPLFKRTTNSSGMAEFPNLRPSHNDPKPIAFIAKKGNNISFMKVNDYNRRLYYYSSDTSGEGEYGDVQNKLKAFVYSDRKMYRPGEKAWFSSIIKDGKWSSNVKDQPIEFKISDPNGRTIFTQRSNSGVFGLNQLSYHFKSNDKTGSYTVSVNLVGEKNRRTFLGSTQIKVEEFQPDRIKIQANFKSPTEKAWFKPEEVTVLASLRNLFGTPVAGSRVRLTQKLMPTSLSFLKFPDYRFSHFNQIKKSVSLEDIELMTDTNGALSHKFDLTKFNQNTFRLIVDLEGFEKESGRSVRTKVNHLISSHDFLVGVKKQKLSYIKEDEKISVDFMAVDSELKNVDPENINVELVREKPIRTLVRQSNGTYQYENLIKKELVEVTPLAFKDGMVNFPLKTEEPGNYFLKVVGINKEVYAKVHFSVIGEGMANLYEKESELEVKLSKNDYNGGENVEVEIKSPFRGAGLITIERDRVYSSKWFQMNTDSKTVKIRLPKSIEGNAYVNVIVIKSTKAKEIMVSPISSKVVNFSINRDKRKLKIDVAHEPLLKPEQTLKIKYKTSQKSKLILFGVDEGILQVAKYKTPNPLAYFFAKKGLSVSSFQTLDMILSDARTVKKYAPGGGSGGALASNLNPFARKALDPVVFWSEILDADKNEKTYEYKIPDYFNGQMRIIAVAVNNDKIGVKKSFVTVRGDLIIMPNVPTFVAPDDQFEVSVILANNIKGEGKRKVKLEIVPDKFISVVENKISEKEIESMRDEVFKIRLKANPKLGASRIKFVATSDNYKAQLAATLSVRPPVHYQFSVWSGALVSHQHDIKFNRDLYPHLSEESAVLSQNPLMALDSISGYLAKYPYGCSEQIISKALASSVLGLREGSRVSKKQTIDFHQDALRIIAGRMNYDGIKLYPSSSSTSNFVGLYAYLYVQEAKKRFLSIPNEIEVGLENLVKRIFRSTDVYLEKAMATYLIAKYQRSPSSFLSRADKYLESDNRLHTMNHLGHLFLASAFQVVGKEKKALTLLNKYKFLEQKLNRRTFYHTRHMHNTLGLYLLAEHFQNAGKDIQKFVSELMMRIGSEVNSLSLATSFLALDSHFTKKNYSPIDGIQVTKKTKDEKGKEKETPVTWNGVKALKMKLNDSRSALYLKNPSKSPFYFSINRSGFDKTKFESELVSGLQITKTLFNEQNSPVTRAKIGEELLVEIAIQAKDGKQHDNVAIVDLLPGGFEPILDMNSGNKVDLSSATYFDRREDRLVFYLPAGEDTAILRYRIKAVNLGSYILPGAFAEDMYDVKVRARSNAKRIEVAK